VDNFTVQVFPIAKPADWHSFCDKIAGCEHADAHRQMMRRLDIKREHIFTLESQGELMVLVWEGVDQDQVHGRMDDLLENPPSDHERYFGTTVIPELHGVDAKAGPPPERSEAATIEP
jgi:hypothetical protein